jgi:hypothetical protein
MYVASTHRLVNIINTPYRLRISGGSAFICWRKRMKPSPTARLVRSGGVAGLAVRMTFHRRLSKRVSRQLARSFSTPLSSGPRYFPDYPFSTAGVERHGQAVARAQRHYRFRFDAGSGREPQTVALRNHGQD